MGFPIMSIFGSILGSRYLGETTPVPRYLKPQTLRPIALWDQRMMACFDQSDLVVWGGPACQDGVGFGFGFGG